METVKTPEKSTSETPSLPPPPTFWEVSRVVEDYLTKCTHFTGWKLDSWQYGEKDRPNVFPFATNGQVGLHASYEDSQRHLRTSVTAAYPLESWWSLVPSLRYRLNKANSSHKFRLDEGGQSVKYSFRNSAFYATARSFICDKLLTDMSGTTRLADKAYLGGQMLYDPTRAGLLNMTVMAVRYECPIFAKGDVALKYSLSDGLSAQLRVPVHRMMDVAVIGEPNRYIVGIHGRSPCGARMILNGNVSDGSITIASTRQIYGTVKFAAAATVPLVGNGEKVRWGVQFIHQDAMVP